MFRLLLFQESHGCKLVGRKNEFSCRERKGKVVVWAIVRIKSLYNSAEFIRVCGSFANPVFIVLRFFYLILKMSSVKFKLCWKRLSVDCCCVFCYWNCELTVFYSCSSSVFVWISVFLCLSSLPVCLSVCCVSNCLCYWVIRLFIDYFYCC